MTSKLVKKRLEAAQWRVKERRGEFGGDGGWKNGFCKGRRNKKETCKVYIGDNKRTGKGIWGGRALKEVYDLAEREGIGRERVDEIIDTMEREGILFSLGRGVVMFVR